MQLTPTERIAAYERETLERVVADAERRLPDRLYLSVGEVAAALSVSESTVKRMIRSRELRARVVSGGLRVPREVVMAYVREGMLPHPRRL